MVRVSLGLEVNLGWGWGELGSRPSPSAPAKSKHLRKCTLSHVREKLAVSHNLYLPVVPRPSRNHHLTRPHSACVHTKLKTHRERATNARQTCDTQAHTGTLHTALCFTYNKDVKSSNKTPQNKGGRGGGAADSPPAVWM